MGNERLCQFCNEINFESLRNPLVSDLPALQRGQADSTRYPFKDKQDDAHKTTLLGTFGEIIQRSKTCRLCQLIEDTLTRHTPGRPLETEICHAEVSFFGVYRDLRGKHYWIRRLSILVEIGTDAYNIGGPKKSLFYAFQACNIGAATIKVDERFLDPRPGIDMMIFGGRQRPLQFDLQWVRRWINTCRADHGDACERADVGLGSTLERIRFIDVQQRCIVTFTGVQLSSYEYITLSYVWGGPQELRLTSSNKNQMAQQGSLAKHLPQTIEDSILVAEYLETRYIWVDSLCIIQDDDGDKAIQIGAMSQIYGFAHLTIIAASSSNVHGGLPGLRPGSRSQEQQEIIVLPESKNEMTGDILPALSLMTALDPLANPSEHFLERTPWNSRGWTMQERVLSRRILVFMPEQVYWICREAMFCEKSYFENNLIRFHRFHANAAERTLSGSFRNFYEPDDDQARFWKTYQNLVASYTRRAFTCKGDIFDGYLAIVQGMSALSGNEFTWGLPRSYFEQGLLWNSFASLQRRKDYSTLPMTSLQVKVPFPSWSWMGWVGEALICIGDERYDIDLGEVPEILCFEHHHSPLRLERVRKGAVGYDSIASRNSANWKVHANQPVTLSDIATQKPQLLPTELGKIPETQIIFFWTSSAFLTVTTPDEGAERSFTIIGSSGNTIGSTGSAERMFDRSQDRYEFIVIGSRRNQFSDPVLLILQIEWLGDIAYRVSSGEVDEIVWEAENHTWKLIPLR
ncbi:HET-domain-containing protein [Hypoxylon trugodes]|uniref:HET-domain-containing protein n=1 Tax=Hypoxylon trugodes TaxID=326681 RepID=UPI00219F5819|nr:HET-domain-containing protein [Hypoxylon trugodes]KAI1387482.1 HET-domain-containing protein [Hypoxylon trugodes]